MADPDISKKQLPAWLGYTIVFTRIGVIGTSIALVILFGHIVLGIPSKLLPETMSIMANTDYLAIITLTAIVMSVLMTWPAIAISWLVAWILSPQIREDMREFFSKSQNQSEESPQSNEEKLDCSSSDSVD